jgi:16S rRNA (cytosine1402-N4)-methyltransferase
MRHIPVLLKETVEALSLKPGAKVIDCTLGDAGHSEEILRRISPGGKLLGLDADEESLERAKNFLKLYQKQITLVRTNFAHVTEVANAEGFNEPDAILMDLGWSTPQFEERGRGFSFEGSERLDMRYDIHSVSQTAAEILNNYPKAELEKIFRQYAEEKFSKEIAEKIGEKRKTQVFETTKDLTNTVLDVYRAKLKSTKEIPWIGGIHPATKVFQALRIEVNQELEVLKKTIPELINLLKVGGRLGIITFHSLEDRIVKQFFKKIEHKKIKFVFKKPLVAGSEELKANPRSRSAKLRVVEKISN